MKNYKINYIVVGAFVLAIIAGFIITLSMLSKKTGATETYFTVYNNVSGIKFGTQVLYEGFPVGQVEKILPIVRDGRQRFKVEFGVMKDWSIPQGSVVLISASGLLSAVVLDIKGTDNTVHLAPGSEIEGESGGNLMSAVSKVAGEMGDLSQQSLRPFLNNLNQNVLVLGEMLRDNFPKLLVNMVDISADLAQKTPRITAEFEQFSQRVNQASARMLSDTNLGRIDAAMGNAENITANLAVMSKELQQTRAKVDQMLVGLDGMTKDNRENMSASTKDMRQILQVVARSIDSVTHNIEGASRNMNEFTRHIRENPSLLLGAKPPRDEVQDAR